MDIFNLNLFVYFRCHGRHLRHGPRETQVLRNVLSLPQPEEVPRGHVDGQIRILDRRRGADRDIRGVACDRVLCVTMESAFDPLSERPSSRNSYKY